jgi:hypothetical protein
LKEIREDSTIVATMMAAAMVMTIPLDSLLPPPPIAAQNQIRREKEPPWRGENSWERKSYLLLL